MNRTCTAFAGLALTLALAGGAFAQSPSPSELHSALHLSPGQEAAWTAYRDATAPDPAARARQRAAQMLLPNLSTPRRIDLIDAEMQSELDGMHRQGDAVKAFYSTLTPQQQHVFDAQTAPRPGDDPDGGGQSPGQ